MDRDYALTAFRPLLVAAAAMTAAAVCGCGAGGAAKLLGVNLPSTTTYTVSGTVSGLAGSGLVVSDGMDSVTLTANGAFKFPSGVMSGMSYSVYVTTPPANPTQTCAVSNDSGTIGSANITNVAISCATASFKVTGYVTGMSGSGLVLLDNGGDAQTMNGDGYFAFAAPVASGQPYSVTVKSAPVNPAQTCAVANAGGVMAATDVSDITVTCTTQAGAPSAQVTPTGAANGTAASALIDSSGGRVVAADGRMVVTIPAGALSAATEISVQPITDEAPGGQGLAYRLGPTGQAFAKPVTLTVNYTGEDVRGSAPPSLRFAYQDPQLGYWHVYKTATLDQAAQTVTVTTPHFSDWALVVGEQLTPYATGVRAGSSVTVDIVGCPVVEVNDPDTVLAAACGTLTSLSSATAVTGWSVNGIVGGNSSVGTLAPSADRTSAVYTPPATTPALNPVRISVQYQPQAGGAAETLLARTTVDSCGTPTGLCSWSGSAHFATAAYFGVAEVVWALDTSRSYGAGLFGFVPQSGSVSVRATDPNCTITPAVVSLPQAMSSSTLIIDYTGATPVYQLVGNAVSNSVTIQCSGQSSSGLSVVFATSATAAAPVSADGKTITGSDPTGGSGSSWTFTAN